MWMSNIFCNDARLLVQEVVALKNEFNVYQFCASTVLMMYTNLHLSLACDHCLGLTSRKNPSKNIGLYRAVMLPQCASH